MCAVVVLVVDSDFRLRLRAAFPIGGALFAERMPKESWGDAVRLWMHAANG